jgi:hypothetical protein
MTHRRFSIPLVHWSVMTCLVLQFGAGAGVYAEGDELKITVGESVRLGDIGYLNTASLGVSNTGIIAAFVPTWEWSPFDGWTWHTYRVSNDGGETWSKPMNALPAVIGGGAEWINLRGGGAIKQGGATFAIPDQEGWFKTTIARFSDDLLTYHIETALLHVPGAQLSLQEPSPHVLAGPVFDKGKMIQLPNGDLLAPMYGKLNDDLNARAFLVRSVDRGMTWTYYASMAYEPVDQNPDLPGQYIGFAEPSIALLANGQMLCIARTQGSHLPPYRPMAVCWSDDQGLTWTRPQLTNPPLYNIWPTLIVLDNGVVACVHGRPGFHVAFSTDNGHTWPHKVTFSDLPEPNLTGQVDGIKIGPNKLMAIGGLGGAEGTHVFPVTVERVKQP